MRVGTILALVGLALAASPLVVGGATAERPGCGPDAVGLARTVEIDARGGPRFGQNQYPGRDLLRDREVVLTFDDGPHKAYTRPILDALDRHCTKATFFMVGQRVLTYPDLAREVARRGHSVGTHTWTHQDLAKIETDEATKEIELAISAVQKLLGQNAAPFFRFPYLSDPSEMRAHLKRRDTAIFSIDVDSYDFKTRSATKVIANVMRQLDEKGRGIILFHDIQPSTAGAIPELLGKLREKGYKVVHLVPSRSQTTVAEYDRRIDKDFAGRRFAQLPPSRVPVAQRTFINPAWDMRIQPEPPQRGSAGLTSAYPPSSDRAAGPAAPQGAPSASAPRPPEAPPARATARTRPEPDWRDSVFKGW